MKYSSQTLQGGVTCALDASYYKGTGSRAGIEREFVLVQIDEENTDREKVL